jgi:hypothetical protein
MPDPATLRDCTEIRLSCETLDGFRDEIEARFTVTIVQDETAECRIIGSPVVIKEVGVFLTRQGVPVE